MAAIFATWGKQRDVQARQKRGIIAVKKTPELWYKKIMRVTFGYAKWTGEYGLFGHFAKRNSTWPPLNLALLGAIVEQAGHEAAIVDGEAEGLSKEKLTDRILATRPDIVGFSAYSPFFHLTCDIAGEIKKINPDIPIMVGGPHITIQKEKALLPQFDYGFMGEAERSLPEFLDIFAGSRDFGKMRGILFRHGKEIVNTGEAWLRDTTMRKSELGGQYPLDIVPLPARHLLPMERYRLGTPNGRDRFTSIQTARGCPWT